MILTQKEITDRMLLYGDLSAAYVDRDNLLAKIEELKPLWAAIVARVELAENRVKAFEAGEDV